MISVTGGDVESTAPIGRMDVTGPGPASYTHRVIATPRTFTMGLMPHVDAVLVFDASEADDSGEYTIYSIEPDENERFMRGEWGCHEGVSGADGARSRERRRVRREHRVQDSHARRRALRHDQLVGGINRL